MCQNFLHILIYGKSVLNVLPICGDEENPQNKQKKIVFKMK
jgi:hypothetical protein